MNDLRLESLTDRMRLVLSFLSNITRQGGWVEMVCILLHHKTIFLSPSTNDNSAKKGMSRSMILQRVVWRCAALCGGDVHRIMRLTVWSKVALPEVACRALLEWSQYEAKEVIGLVFKGRGHGGLTKRSRRDGGGRGDFLWSPGGQLLSSDQRRLRGTVGQINWKPRR